MKWLLPLNPDTLSGRAEQRSRARVRGSVVLSKTTETYSGQLWLLGHSTVTRNNYRKTPPKKNNNNKAKHEHDGVKIHRGIVGAVVRQTAGIMEGDESPDYNPQDALPLTRRPLNVMWCRSTSGVVFLIGKSHKRYSWQMSAWSTNGKVCDERQRPIAAAAMKMKVFLCCYY